MPHCHRYTEIAALIAAIGDRWFGRTLQCTLQTLFHYDYFLLAHYCRGRPLQVVASDLDGDDARRAIYWLERETCVLEPIFRLHNAGQAVGGVHDMSALVAELPSLLPPDIDPARLPHVVEDPAEEIGWRTMGWPRHQQETCVLVKTGRQTLLAISLYNMELDRPAPQSAQLLRELFPVLEAVLRQHANTPAGRAEADPEGVPTGISGASTSAGQPADINAVKRFFSGTLEVTLTERELSVFARLLNGATVPAIAQALGISINTVRTHRRNVYRRMGHGRLPELINRFHQNVEQLQHDRFRQSQPAPVPPASDIGLQ